jgi:membrane protein DedA with SNARE-associated domain
MEEAPPAENPEPAPPLPAADDHRTEATATPPPPAPGAEDDRERVEPGVEGDPDAAAEPADDDLADDDLAKPSRRTLILLIAPIIILSTAGTIATAFTPTLATRHPLLLIALDARNRMLVLAREVDLVPFVVVAFLRRSLSDPLFYLLGRLYGDRAIRWLEKKGGGGELVKMTERWFAKASYLMVFVFPGAIVCALAGATRMRPIAFAACNVGGTLASIAAVRVFSDTISSPVEALLGFFDRNLVLTTSITVGLVVLSLVLNKVQGRLDADLDELDDDDATGVPPSEQSL